MKLSITSALSIENLPQIECDGERCQVNLVS